MTTAERLVTCPACGKLVPPTKTGKPSPHTPSVRHPEALLASGRCSRQAVEL